MLNQVFTERQVWYNCELCSTVYSEENTVEIIMRNVFKQVVLCYKTCKCNSAVSQDSTEAGSAFLFEVQIWSPNKHID